MAVPLDCGAAVISAFLHKSFYCGSAPLSIGRRAYEFYQGARVTSHPVNTVAWVEGNTPNAVDPSGMIYETPAAWNVCYARQLPSITVEEPAVVTAARNATILVRTVNYRSDLTPKTCDPRGFNSETIWISGLGLGTLGTLGFWTHDHYENWEQQRTEGEKGKALSNIRTHDYVQFIGKNDASITTDHYVGDPDIRDHSQNLSQEDFENIQFNFRDPFNLSPVDMALIFGAYRAGVARVGPGGSGYPHGVAMFQQRFEPTYMDQYGMPNEFQLALPLMEFMMEQFDDEES